MKILIFNFEYPPLGGGGAVATRQLAGQLAKKHQVTVITTHYRNLPREQHEDNVHVIRVPVIGRRSIPTSSLVSLLTYVPAAFLAGLKCTKKTRFDVINAQFVLPSGIPAAALSRLRAIPLVMSFIGGDVYDPTKFSSPHRHGVLRMLIRKVANQAQVGTAISHDTKKKVVRYHKVAIPIEVIPLGVEPDTCQQARLEPTETDVPHFVSIGRLVPRKGYLPLLEAWQSVPYARLTIMGEGPQYRELTDYVHSHNLSDRVHLTGYASASEKHSHLCAATAYISASEHEGFGIVFLEAMQHALPIIAGDHGGHRDFLRDGHNAILISKPSPKSLAAAANKLIANPALARTLGRNGHRDAARYKTPAVAAEFETIFRKLINETST